MIPLLVILAIRYLASGSSSIDGIRFPILGAYLRSLRFRVDLHSSYIQFLNGQCISDHEQRVERQDIRRCEVYAWMLLHADASSRRMSLHLMNFGMVTNLLQYGTLQFGQFEEIQKKGYNAAMKMLAKWEAEGRLPSEFVDDKDRSIKERRKGRSARRNSV
jgi:hypothetical protein